MFTPDEFEDFKVFIKNCTQEQAAVIVDELRIRHGICVFNQALRALDEVESVSINGKSIQLNLQNLEDE